MRHRIVRVAVLSTAIALALFVIPLAIAIFNLSVADARSQLERDALNAVTVVDPQFSVTDRPEIPGPTDPRGQLGLYNAEGRLIAGSGPALADAPSRQALSGNAGRVSASGMGGDLIDVIPVTAGERIAGVVRTSLPLAVVIGGDLAVWAIMLVGAAACFLVGVLIARRSARAVADPIEDLVRSVRAVGDGDFQARTTPSGVSEVDAAGVALADTATRLGILIERERLLTQDASHQLRTPLAGLRVTLEQEGASAAALERVDALSATIDDFLATDRKPGGVRTDLAIEAEQLQRRWHGALASVDRPLRISIEAGVGPVTTVPALLRQILDVLVENAMLHGSGTVTVHFRDASEAVAIDVEDEGGTIELDDEIFRRGYSGNGRSGVGLALALQLANDLGGSLLLAARRPRTRFTLLLPN